MPVTANANLRCRKIAIGSLAWPIVEKRRNLNWVIRSGTECISKKAAPQVSSVASDTLSEEEVTQRAREGDRATFECVLSVA